MRKSSFWGIFFIILGLVLILNNFYHFAALTWVTLWPLFVLVPGLLFEFEYLLTKKNSGILVPGGILTTIGILFFFETFTNWNYSGYTWPIYTLAVAVGLSQLYIAEKNRNKGLLIPIFILGTFSILAFAQIISKDFLPWLNETMIFPIILILIGILILIKKAIK